MKSLSCIAIALLFFVSSSNAQTKKDTLSIERALSFYSTKALVFSPDGSKAVAVVSQTGAADDLPASHIWLIDIAAKSLWQFTYSPKSETAPKWSPDGKTLAFLSGRNGKPQIFIMHVSGGEAMQLTTSKTGVKSYEWKPSGGSIAYMDEEPESDAKQKREDDKYDENVVSESSPTRIFTIDIDTKKATQVFKQKWEVDEMKWMPHGDSLLLITQTLPTKEIPEQRLMLYSIKDSAAITIPSPAHPFWDHVMVTPDGKNIIYDSGRNGAPGGNDILSQPLKSGEAKNLTIDLDRDVMDVKLLGDHNLLAMVQNGFMVRLYEVSDKAKVKDYGINKNVFGFDVAKNGSVIFEGRAPDAMPEIWFAGTDKKPVQISHFNKVFDSIALIKPKYFTYKSFDGLKIEGAIYKPANSGAKPLPLVVFIHGGPTGAFYDIYSPWVQLFVQKGYAVFCPNIRGSTGYGINYITSNRNDWGGSDFKDIMAGMDYLIANENIDSAKMGISGWSYGGFMSEWAITQTHRFKAAMSGAGLADLASEFGTEDNAAYDKWSMGSPYEQPDVFYKHSPITYIKNAKTPTLIIQGEEDETDPKGQSQQLYRGLRFYNVPTELVLYPREPHGFKEIKHSIDFYTRMLAWFEKYIPADVKPAPVKK